MGVTRSHGLYLLPSTTPEVSPLLKPSPVASHSFKTVSKGPTVAHETSCDLSLTVCPPTPLPLTHFLPATWPFFRRFSQHTKPLLPQGLYICWSLDQKALCPGICMAHSLTSLRSLPSCHLLRKALLDLPVPNSPPFNLLPPLSLFYISPLPALILHMYFLFTCLSSVLPTRL